MPLPAVQRASAGWRGGGLRPISAHTDAKDSSAASCMRMRASSNARRRGLSSGPGYSQPPACTMVGISGMQYTWWRCGLSEGAAAGAQPTLQRLTCQPRVFRAAETAGSTCEGMGCRGYPRGPWGGGPRTLVLPLQGPPVMTTLRNKDAMPVGSAAQLEAAVQVLLALPGAECQVRCLPQSATLPLACALAAFGSALPPSGQSTRTPRPTPAASRPACPPSCAHCRCSALVAARFPHLHCRHEACRCAAAGCRRRGRAGREPGLHAGALCETEQRSLLRGAVVHLQPPWRGPPRRLTATRRQETGSSAPVRARACAGRMEACCHGRRSAQTCPL